MFRLSGLCRSRVYVFWVVLVAGFFCCAGGGGGAGGGAGYTGRFLIAVGSLAINLVKLTKK